ncbi:MAG: adenylate cyclase [Paracoccaceae bacterium]|jgi:adenylate cyclase
MAGFFCRGGVQRGAIGPICPVMQDRTPDKTSTPAANAPDQTVFLDRFEEIKNAPNKYTEAALERHKAEGLSLAVRARWVAMVLIGVFLALINPHWDVIYYHFILAVIAVNGWLMWRVGRVGQSGAEMALIFVDLVVMTVGMVMPNPLSESDMPLAMQYRFENFLYFFVILAAGTLAYSWRTVLAIGTWTAVLWTLGAVVAWWFAAPVPGLSEAAQASFAAFPRVADLMDPNSFNFRLRIQEVVVFMIVAVTLALSVRRFNALLISNAGLERERANLSRYFSPNVVEELSQNDEPLKQIRTQDVAVLFIDIVNFTGFSSTREPAEVIHVLRGFHARMEAAIFRFDGTLDKYLGDGLMATFGTPREGKCDATHALKCARLMNAVMDQWNRERVKAGEPEICAGIGIHYGSAVLGDIGANRLEFAVIGNTVNVSSRLEAMTRTLNARVIMSDDLRKRVVQESGDQVAVLDGFTRSDDQNIRGIDEKMAVWTLGKGVAETSGQRDP